MESDRIRIKSHFYDVIMLLVFFGGGTVFAVHTISEYGGILELWKADDTGRYVKILPLIVGPLLFITAMLFRILLNHRLQFEVSSKGVVAHNRLKSRKSLWQNISKVKVRINRHGQMMAVRIEEKSGKTSTFYGGFSGFEFEDNTKKSFMDFVSQFVEMEVIESDNKKDLK